MMEARAFEVEESRRRPRFVLKEPLSARFAGFEVLLQDVSESGCQIRHAEPLKIGASASLQFVNPLTREALSFDCRLVWSRLVIHADARERVYHSGLRFRGIGGNVHAALAKFVTRYGNYDRESLRKKQAVLERKSEDRRSSVAIYKRRDDIPPEVMAAILEARDFLQLNATIATNWYQRARFARMNLAASDVQIPYADDVLAVWELLSRKYPLSVVALALSRQP